MRHNSLIALTNSPAYGDFKKNVFGEKLWRPLECYCDYEGTFDEADKHWCDGNQHCQRFLQGYKDRAREMATLFKDHDTFSPGSDSTGRLRRWIGRLVTAF